MKERSGYYVCRELGQAMIEYVIILALISLLTTSLVTNIGGSNKGILTKVGDALELDTSGDSDPEGVDPGGDPSKDPGDSEDLSSGWSTERGYILTGEDDPSNPKFRLDPTKFKYTGTLNGRIREDGKIIPESYSKVSYIGEYPRNSKGDIVFTVPSEVTCINTGDQVHEVRVLDDMFKEVEESKDSIEGSNVVIATESDVYYMSSPFEGMGLKNVDLTRVKGRNLRIMDRLSALDADNIYMFGGGNKSRPAMGNLFEMNKAGGYYKVGSIYLPEDFYLNSDAGGGWGLSNMNVDRLKSTGGKIMLTLPSDDRGLGGPIPTAMSNLLRDSTILEFDFPSVVGYSHEDKYILGYNVFNNFKSNSVLDLTEFNFVTGVNNLNQVGSGGIAPDFSNPYHGYIQRSFEGMEVPEVIITSDAAKLGVYVSNTKLIGTIKDFMVDGLSKAKSDVKLTVIED